jgi:hypothetical protein
VRINEGDTLISTARVVEGLRECRSTVEFVAREGRPATADTPGILETPRKPGRRVVSDCDDRGRERVHMYT